MYKIIWLSSRVAPVEEIGKLNRSMEEIMKLVNVQYSAHYGFSLYSYSRVRVHEIEWKHIDSIEYKSIS